MRSEKKEKPDHATIRTVSIEAFPMILKTEVPSLDYMTQAVE